MQQIDPLIYRISERRYKTNRIINDFILNDSVKKITEIVKMKEVPLVNS